MDARIIKAEVQALARDWGITGRVIVKRVKRRTYAGQHQAFKRLDGRVEHHISVDGRDPEAEVADTIAHELCHAHQLERVGFTGWCVLVDEQARLPHAERPIEVEAYAWGRERRDEVAKRCFR